MTEGVLYAELAAKITNDIWQSVQRPKKDWTGTACCAYDCENLGDFENAFQAVVIQGEDTHNVLLHGPLGEADCVLPLLFIEEGGGDNNNNTRKRTPLRDEDGDDDEDTSKSPLLAAPITKKTKKKKNNNNKSKKNTKHVSLRFAAVKTPGPFRWADIMRASLKLEDPDKMARLVQTVKLLNPDWRTWMSDKYVLACKEKFGVNDINDCLSHLGGGDFRAHPKRPLLKILKVQVGMHSDAFIEWSERMASLLTTEWTDRVLYTAIESEWIWNDCNKVRCMGMRGCIFLNVTNTHTGTEKGRSQRHWR